MSTPSVPLGEVTQTLAAMQNGCSRAADRFWRLTEQRVAALARRLKGAGSDRDIWTDELVSAVYLRAQQQRESLGSSRAFLGFARLTILRAMCDLGRAARRRQRAEAEAGRLRRNDEPDDRVVEILEALATLRACSPARAQVVELHGLLGASHAEIGESLGMSERTSQRLWASARAWLRSRLASDASADREPNVIADGQRGETGRRPADDQRRVIHPQRRS